VFLNSTWHVGQCLSLGLFVASRASDAVHWVTTTLLTCFRSVHLLDCFCRSAAAVIKKFRVTGKCVALHVAPQSVPLHGYMPYMLLLDSLGAWIMQPAEVLHANLTTEKRRRRGFVCRQCADRVLDRLVLLRLAVQYCLRQGGIILKLAGDATQYVCSCISSCCVHTYATPSCTAVASLAPTASYQPPVNSSATVGWTGICIAINSISKQF
jgi:hypothetical protein